MLMAPSSLSAWTKVRPSSGMRRDKIFQDLSLRSDRIAKIGLEAGAYGGFCDGLITFPHFTCHVLSIDFLES